MIPLIFKIKDDMDEKSYTVCSWLYFLIAVVSGVTSLFELNWSISKVVCYIGFVLAGYQIKRITEKKNNVKGILCIILSFVLLLIVTYIQYGHTIKMIAEADEKYSIVGEFNPIVVFASLFMFAGFSLLHIETHKMERLAKDTFLIYLFHAGIWQTGAGWLFGFVNTKTDPLYTIPLGVIAVFFVSWALSRLYGKIWALINRNDRIYDKLCKFFGF